MTKFELGRTIVTARIWYAMEIVKGFSEFVEASMLRYVRNDWGDLCDEDKALDDESVNNEGRLLAAYNLPNDLKFDGEEKIWIVTECDRSVTTVLFPSDY